VAVFLPVCGVGCSLRVRARTPCGVLIAWCVCTAAGAHVQPLSGTDTRGTARYRQCTERVRTARNRRVWWRGGFRLVRYLAPVHEWRGAHSSRVRRTD
jgi:hypothetical protein